MISRDMFIIYLSCNNNMVNSWMTYVLQGRLYIVEHRLACNTIYRIAIHWRLLVEFYCNSHKTLYTLYYKLSLKVRIKEKPCIN